MVGSETFQSNLENRFAAVDTTTDVNQNLMDVVRVLREEGTRLCEMQRKGRKSKLSEETLGLMKERRENPPVTSSAKRTLNREISKHVRRDLRDIKAAFHPIFPCVPLSKTRDRQMNSQLLELSRKFSRMDFHRLIFRLKFRPMDFDGLIFRLGISASPSTESRRL
ncbi:hypothetical protein ACJJTC_013758 [Scirpophaga incertulas]